MLRKNLRKVRISILLALVALLILVPMIGPTQKVKAATRVTYYTVRYACLISPGYHQGDLEGEWTLDCDDNMTGWGWEPGESCTYTEVSYGRICDRQPFEPNP